MGNNKHWIEQLTNSSHIGMLVVDRERNNLFVNDQLCKMFGYKKEFLLQNTAEIFHVNHDTFLNFADLAFDAVLSGTPLSIDYQLKKQDGSLFWLHISGDPIKSNKEVLWTMVDVTQIVLAQEKEHKQTTLLEQSQHIAHIGSWEYIPSSDILSCSKEIYNIFELDSSELATFEAFNQRIHPEDREYVESSYSKSLEDMLSYKIKHRILMDDGRVKYVVEQCKNSFNAKGNLVSIGIVQDVTDETLIEIKKNQQSQMIEQIHDSIIATDLEGIITSFNHGSQLLLGYKADEIIGSHITKLYLEKDFDKLGKNIEKLLKDGESHSEINLVKKSGAVIHANLSLFLLKDDKGNSIGMVGYSQDITRRRKIETELEEQNKILKQAEKKLTESNNNLTQYLDAIDKLDIGLFVVRDDFTIQHMNQTMIKWFGNQEGKICYSSVANLDEPCPYCQLSDVIFNNKKVIYEPTTPDGQSFDIVATSIKNLDGTTSKMEVIRNVTDQKKIQNQLYHQAHHDVLTQLPNRILFNDRLEQAIEKAKRNSLKFALLFIDLDHFKEINDSLGHTVGDEILKIVTSRLKEIIRDEDTVARLGGDEFTIILENLNQIQDASLIATKILKILSQAMKVKDNTLYVSSSIGISIYPDDGESTQNLLKFADSAMYKAKDEGRNNYQYYNSSMTELAFERVLMETSLRNAIKEEEFVVYYQPQVNGVTNKLVGMEALVRWQHPTMGLVSPAKFIPLAETTGLIVELDRLVMKTAMTQIAKWYKEGLNPGVLAMNLAVKQLKQKDSIEMFQSLMIETGCKSEWIELEVTEGQIMKNPEEAIEILTQIRELGIELAVDDFGTGYSSLAYLKKLPINKLKIDQVFVRDLPGDEEDAGITKAVIALARSLNLKVIAEGVETKEQRDFLVENGCENIQGYYYSKPVAADEFKNILLNGFS